MVSVGVPIRRVSTEDYYANARSGYQKGSNIGNRAWLLMVVVAVGLVIGGQDVIRNGSSIVVPSSGDSRYTSDADLRMDRNGLPLEKEEVDYEAIAYGYLAFAYAIGLGPAGKRETMAGEPDKVEVPIRSNNGVIGIQDRTAISTEGIQALVCRPEFQWPCTWILGVIDCESTYRPEVVGSQVIEGIRYYFYGLLQVHHPDPPGTTNEYLLQPYLNLVEGHIQYVEWKAGERSDPWPNCP